MKLGSKSLGVAFNDTTHSYKISLKSVQQFFWLQTWEWLDRHDHLSSGTICKECILTVIEVIQSQYSAVTVALVQQLVTKNHFQTTQSSAEKSHALCFSNCNDTLVIMQVPIIYAVLCAPWEFLYTLVFNHSCMWTRLRAIIFIAASKMLLFWKSDQEQQMDGMGNQKASPQSVMAQWLRTATQNYIVYTLFVST
jgi:hypothetical protein